MIRGSQFMLNSLQKAYNMVIMQSRLGISQQNSLVIAMWLYVYKFNVKITFG
jgi:hypothetical protein